MRIFQNLQKGISSFSRETKKVFDTTKIEMRIKGYSNEADAVFIEIGKLIYENRMNLNKAKQKKIEDLFKDVDNIKHRINNLEKNLTDMKKIAEEKNDIIVIAGGSKNYAKLNRKEDDFKIVRTESGISLLRFCPQCSCENKSENSKCVKCGYEFKTKTANTTNK